MFHNSSIPMMYERHTQIEEIFPGGGGVNVGGGGSGHVFWYFYNVIKRNLNFTGGGGPSLPPSRSEHERTEL